MKRLLPVLALCLLPGWGGAQVIVHQAALDQLAGIAPAGAAPAGQAVVPGPAPAPMVRHVVRPVRRKRIYAPSVVAFEQPPPLPSAAPVTQAARPPVPAPAAPRPPAAPPARPIPVVLPPPAAAALRFAAGSAELPAGAAAILKPICTAAEPSGTVDVAAPAPASPGDPSLGMRLAMQRAFAVRDALAACGISPARIIPRAVGAAGGADPDTARISLSAFNK